MSRIGGLLLAAVCLACAPAPYAPAIDGPSATLRFTSPYLEDQFMSIDRLQLVVLSTPCRGEVVGRIVLDAEAVGIAAATPIHLRLWMNTNEFMGSNQTNSADLTFVPREGVAYHLVHIDNPGRIRFELEASDDAPVEVTRGCPR